MDILNLLFAAVAAVAAVVSAVMAYKAHRGSSRTETIATQANTIAKEAKQETARLANAAELSAKHQGTVADIEQGKLASHFELSDPGVSQRAGGKYISIFAKNKGPSRAYDIQLKVSKDGESVPVEPAIVRELDGEGTRTDCSFKFNVDTLPDGAPDSSKKYEIYLAFKNIRQEPNRTPSRSYRFHIGNVTNPRGDWVVDEQ